MRFVKLVLVVCGLIFVAQNYGPLARLGRAVTSLSLKAIDSVASAAERATSPKGRSI